MLFCGPEEDVNECLQYLLDDVVPYLVADTEKARARDLVVGASSLLHNGKSVRYLPPNAMEKIAKLTDLVAMSQHMDDDAALADSSGKLLRRVKEKGVELRRLCTRWLRHSDCRDLYARQLWAEITNIRKFLQGVPQETTDAGVLLATRNALLQYEKFFENKQQHQPVSVREM